MSLSIEQTICRTKASYKSQSEAKRVARLIAQKTKGRKLATYFCTECKHYHLTGGVKGRPICHSRKRK